MFSGIVETIGTLIHAEMREGCKYFTIAPKNRFDDLIVGESIAVNGVCLTVTHFSADAFSVTAVPETLRLTNLELLTPHHEVNLERSLKANSRIGGHHVQGHIDTKGQILEIKKDNSDALLVKISIPQKFAKYIVDKGYISLDGMSITIIQATPEWFTVTLIPHTQAVTITQHYGQGTWVNIEVDMMAKYIEKLLGSYTYANTH